MLAQRGRRLRGWASILVGLAHSGVSGALLAVQPGRPAVSSAPRAHARPSEAACCFLPRLASVWKQLQKILAC